MDIGFIGLGNMGFHMARRLIEAGHSVIALDTRKDVLERMVALGASPAGSPKEVADRAETVMASLPTPDIVLQVATGPGGIIEGQRVRRFVDLSTTGSSMARRIFDLLKARAIVQVDAPVSGGVGDFGRRARGDSAARREIADRFLARVVDGEAVSGLNEPAGHGGAHIAEPNEADVHRLSPSLAHVLIGRARGLVSLRPFIAGERRTWPGVRLGQAGRAEDRRAWYGGRA